MILSRTDFYVTEVHYADHVLPVEEELLSRNLPARVVTRLEDVDPANPGPVVVASYGDLRRVRGIAGNRPLVLMEHGAGQTYGGAGRDAYADGEDLAGVVLCLVPGYHAAQARARGVGPRTRVVRVGLTKLNDLLVARAPFYSGRKDPTRKPVVAFGWHWDCRVCRETRATWPRWMGAVESLASRGEWAVLGHGHPREWPRLEPEYRRLGIPTARRFEDVVGRADVYCVDNSSTAFEAVAVGLPVILLDAPGWERASYGLRFGMEADYLDRCSEPDLLRGAVQWVLSDPLRALERQQKALHTVYEPRFGGPSKAADEIELLMRGIRGPIC